MAYGELYEIFQVADSVTSLYYDNRLGCGYSDIVTALTDKCLENDGAACTIWAHFDNMFQVHMIESIGQGTTLANAMKEFSLSVEKEVIYEQTLTIGKSMGALTAFAYDL